jgi:hypothetical protein
VKGEAVKGFDFLLAFAVEEAGLALSNAEAVRGETEVEAVELERRWTLRWRSERG